MIAVPTIPQVALAHDGPPDPDLIRIRDLIYQVAGIFHPDKKLSLVLDGCRRRMKKLKIQTLREYLACLTARLMRQTELMTLLNEITIGETCFFRNRPQLDALRRFVLPEILAAKAGRPRRLRLWSAGCSTGEEPYTLSMVMQEEAHGQLKGWAVDILATDINQRSLDCARRAVYGSHSTRHLTPHLRARYFAPVGSLLQVQPAVRSQVRFSRLNLFDDARMTLMRGLDIIFCCNVLLYFDLASKRRVIQHFYDNLLPHGYLFVGESESLFRISDDFRLVLLPGAIVYVKGGGRGEAGR